MEKLSPESREVLKSLIRDTILEVLKESRSPVTYTAPLAYDPPPRNSDLSPETLILSEKDFIFLTQCGISSKGMLLGEWK